MPLLEENSVDLIICDLPYGLTRCAWDSPLDLEKLWKEYERLAHDHTAIILFAQPPFDKVLACSNLKMFRYEIIWEKTYSTNHLNSKKMPLHSHENLLCFYKKLPTYNPQKTFGHPLKTVKAASRKSIDVEIWNKHLNFVDYNSTERYPRSVIKFGSDRLRESYHPTQKPQKLIEYLIKTYSNKGDLVLDNCIGSGTTAAAAITQDRRFIGIEKEEKYFNIAVERIGKVRKKEEEKSGVPKKKVG